MNTLLTRLTNFNPEKSEISLKLLYINEEILGELLDLHRAGSMVKVNIKKGRYKENTRDTTRRRWFQIITHILKQKDIPLTKENVNAFHETMKESFFDVQKFEVEGSEIVVVPSINAMTDEQVRVACENIIARYSQIGINFDEIT
jgi:hypothetical protein